jgi:DNA-3-methyladenine glycosylase
LKKDYKKLRKEFYTKDTKTVAKELIGKVLYKKAKKGYLSGIIVETEAYLGEKDPASHAYRGKKKRNEVMFEEGGKVYVYFTYGNHFCFNVVTGKKDSGCAVLIRALEPVSGIEEMMENRNTRDVYNLTSGPGKITRALNIDKHLNGASLMDDEIFICNPGKSKRFKIARSRRIGISKNTDRLFRFYMVQNRFVSRNLTGTSGTTSKQRKND